MQDVLHWALALKDVFVFGLAGKMVKAKDNPLGTELLKKKKVDEETNAETWTPSKKWHKMNTWQDYMNQQTDVPKELDADFKYPKIYLITHSVKQIHWYGALQ